MKTARPLPLCLALALLAACSGGGGYLVSPALRTAPDARVAVLPFDNQSTDMNADEIMRRLVSEGFGKRGYAPLSPEAVDGWLSEMGVSEGGQLAGVKPDALGRALGADLLCYGDVEDFTFQNLGFVVRKNVKLNVKLVSAASGETLYEGYGTGRDVKVYVNKDEAKAAFVEQMAVKLVQNIFKTPLKREAETAAWKALDRLPAR